MPGGATSSSRPWIARSGAVPAPHHSSSAIPLPVARRTKCTAGQHSTCANIFGSDAGDTQRAPIALDFLKQALKDKPPTPFRVPPGIKLIRVNASSGTRAGSGEGGGTILEAFKPGTAPPDAYVAPAAPAAVPPDAGAAAQAGGVY